MSDSAVNGGSAKVRNQTLHQLVGYAELTKASGVSRSTIERAWRGPWDPGEPQLPKPGKIGSRSVWAADDANAWLLARARWQSGVLNSFAKTDPDDLEPDQLHEAARDLAAKAWSKHIGKPVDAEHLVLHLTRKITQEEFEAAEIREFEHYQQRFAHLSLDRATTLAAWLFVTLRCKCRVSISRSCGDCGCQQPSVLNRGDCSPFVRRSLRQRSVSGMNQGTTRPRT